MIALCTKAGVTDWMKFWKVLFGLFESASDISDVALVQRISDWFCYVETLSIYCETEAYHNV